MPDMKDRHCPDPDVSAYGQSSLDGYWCRTCRKEWGPGDGERARAHGGTTDVCPTEGCIQKLRPPHYVSHAPFPCITEA